MRFVQFDEGRFGLLTRDGGVVDLSERLDMSGDEPLVEYAEGEYDLSEYENSTPDYDVDEVTLQAPVRRPGKVVAAPLNYEAHIEEAIADRDIDLDDWFSIEDRGYFLKAPSSVIGSDEPIQLPFSDRRVDHEIELGFVIGEDTRDVTSDAAWDRILGYTILLDITVRGEQDRSGRKSYDTFTVVGPCVATPDEIDDPQNLDLRLTVNGEPRQDANTSDMVYTCADIVQYASLGTTLEAGDVVTTGTPAGVGPIEDGDVVTAKIDGIGSMSVDVEGRDVAFSELDVRKSGLD